MSLNRHRGGVSLYRCVLCVTGLAFAVCTASAGELTRYREFELGSSVAAVTAVTLTRERDLKTIHARPALLQEIAWQPRYMSGAQVADRKSIKEVVFSFVDNQLFKMIVTYERDQTTGLTNADMIAALAELYGPPMAAAARPRATDNALDAATVIAEWRQEDAQVALRHSRYSETFSLVITSPSLDVVADKAGTTALAMDVREAPGREAALARKRADDERQAEEQARTTNKKVFKP